MGSVYASWRDTLIVVLLSLLSHGGRLVSGSDEWGPFRLWDVQTELICR